MDLTQTRGFQSLLSVKLIQVTKQEVDAPGYILICLPSPLF